MIERDPHCGPVPQEAWDADAAARARGRVEIFNAVRPGGLDRRRPPAVPEGGVRNHCTFTKVDLEGRCLVERLPRVSPQRIVRWRDG